MSRTDRILQAISSAVERRRASFDADDTVQALTVTVKLNEGGWPKLVEIERREREDLTASKH